MWNAISNVLIALSLLCSSVAVWLSVRNAVVASELRRVLRRLDASKPQLLAQRLDELEQTLSLLANRLKMTKVRAAVTHTDRDKGGEPNAGSDPEAWRAWKNAQLRAGIYN